MGDSKKVIIKIIIRSIGSFKLVDMRIPLSYNGYQITKKNNKRMTFLTFMLFITQCLSHNEENYLNKPTSGKKSKTQIYSLTICNGMVLK